MNKQDERINLNLKSSTTENPMKPVILLTTMVRPSIFSLSPDLSAGVPVLFT